MLLVDLSYLLSSLFIVINNVVIEGFKSSIIINIGPDNVIVYWFKLIILIYIVINNVAADVLSLHSDWRRWCDESSGPSPHLSPGPVT